MSAVALDTNVLAYAEGLQRTAADAAKVSASRDLMRKLATARVRATAPIQVLAELHHVLVRRGGHTPATAGSIVEAWSARADLVETDATVFAAALSLARDHNLQIFDAVILAGASQAACDALLSEDMHDGFVWRGVEVINPFAIARQDRLKRLLGV